MGLTESNQSKSGLWGPAKSRSTPHFYDRRFEGKPRQAATLPARSHASSDPLSSKKNSSESSSCHYEQASSCRSRRRTGETLRRDISQNGNCSSTDRNKRKSDPLLEFLSSRGPAHNNVAKPRHSKCFNHDNDLNGSPETSPNPNCRQRPTAMYISDDQIDDLVSQSILKKRSKEKGREEPPLKFNRDNHEVNCEEKETQTSPQSTLYRCPHEFNRVNSPSNPCEIPQPDHRKKNKISDENLSCSVPATFNNLESDPYICLHYDDIFNSNYGGSNGNVIFHKANHITSALFRPVISEISLFVPEEEEFEPPSPKNLTSQIVINVENLRKPSFENIRYINDNSNSVQVCSNVWFESVSPTTSNIISNSSITSKDIIQKGKRSSASGLPSSSSKIYCDRVSSSEDFLIGPHSFSPFCPSRISLNYPEANFPQVSFPYIDHEGFLETESIPSYSSIYSTNLPRVTDDFSIKPPSNPKVVGSDNRKDRLLPNGVFPAKRLSCNDSDSSNFDNYVSSFTMLRNSTAKDHFKLVCPKDVKQSIRTVEEAKSYLFNLYTELNKESKIVPHQLEKNKTHQFHSLDVPTLSLESFLIGAENKDTEKIACFDLGTYPVLRLPKPDSQPRLVDLLKQESAIFKESGTKYCLEEETHPLDQDKINSSTDVSGRNDSSIYEKTCRLLDPGGCLPIDKNGDRPSSPAVAAAVCDAESFTSESVMPSFQSDRINFRILSNKDLAPKDGDGFASKNFRDERVLKGLRAKSDCSYTCHEQCQDVVSLDCKATISPDSDESESILVEDCLESSLLLLSEDEQPSSFGDDLSKEPSETEIKNRYNNVVQRNLETAFEHQTEKCHEEEKHEAELQEKHLLEINSEVKDEQEQQHEEGDTLRRTVCRIQSSTVVGSEIEEWVEKCTSGNQGLQIAKEYDGSFRGCLRIHLNLSRPINIVAGSKPPSIYDILQEDRTMEKTLTSFYMPRDAVKAIHITSNTTTRDVIVALLRKFKVVDNPQKFALYEKTFETRQSLRGKLRKLEDNECPLILAISWSAQKLDNKRLVLQENDTADIQWEAFSLPELDNFLKILDREEEEYKNQIRDKYSLLRKRIQGHLVRVHSTN